MKVEKEKIINDNGSYTIKEVRTQDSSDGFVQKSEMYPASMDNRGKYFKGKSMVTSFTTNDPRITRPFAYGVCGLFLVIGICLALAPGFMNKIMAVFFIVIPVIGFKTAKRDIDAIEEELKKKQAEKQAQEMIEAQQMMQVESMEEQE